jgi:uncharacterized protein
VEASSALTRMHKGRRLSAAQLRTALRNLETIWASLYVHAVTEEVIETASGVVFEHALRAYDALHLASVVAFDDDGQMAVACWDRELRDAARRRGFTLVPERL